MKLTALSSFSFDLGRFLSIVPTFPHYPFISQTHLALSNRLVISVGWDQFLPAKFSIIQFKCMEHIEIYWNSR